MSTTVTYKGATLATVNNQTKTLLTSGTWLEDDLTLVDVTAGGASNFVTGTFTADSTQGAHSVTLSYTGNGYPIAALVFVEGGAYNSSNTAWYSAIDRYAIGFFAASKSDTTSTPTYGTSGTQNAAVVASIYKSSTSNSTSYSRNSAMNQNFLTSSAPGSGALTAVNFSNKTTLRYMTKSSSGYGLKGGINYRYIVVYSS